MHHLLPALQTGKTNCTSHCLKPELPFHFQNRFWSFCSNLNHSLSLPLRKHMVIPEYLVGTLRTQKSVSALEQHYRQSTTALKRRELPLHSKPYANSQVSQTLLSEKINLSGIERLSTNCRNTRCRWVLQARCCWFEHLRMEVAQSAVWLVANDRVGQKFVELLQLLVPCSWHWLIFGVCVVIGEGQGSEANKLLRSVLKNRGGTSCWEGTSEQHQFWCAFGN